MALGVFGAAAIALLWSWNTLAELTGAPTAEFRHVLAAIVIAVVARLLLTSHQRRRHHLT
jgi:hypothetical protein